MKLPRVFVLAIAALTGVLVVTAYRRAARSGDTLGAELRALVGEWSCPALRERARRATLDGLQAAESRAEAADRELAAAVPAR